MNERIHDLMMQATEDMDNSYYWPGQYVDAFAQLIIKECAITAAVEWLKFCDEEPDTSRKAFDIGKILAQHFGVE